MITAIQPKLLVNRLETNQSQIQNKTDKSNVSFGLKNLSYDIVEYTKQVNRPRVLKNLRAWTGLTLAGAGSFVMSFFLQAGASANLTCLTGLIVASYGAVKLWNSAQELRKFL